MFVFGFYTVPALGAGFPAQTYMKIPQAAVANDYAKHGRFKVSYTFCDTQVTPTGSQACDRQAGSSTGCKGHPCDVVYDIVDLNDQLSIPVDQPPTWHYEPGPNTFAILPAGGRAFEQNEGTIDEPHAVLITPHPSTPSGSGTWDTRVRPTALAH